MSANEEKFSRITVAQDQMGGVACIRSLRIPVATIVGLLGEGSSVKEILEDYPDLEAEDIHQALQFAAEALQEKQIPIIKKEVRNF